MGSAVRPTAFGLFAAVAAMCAAGDVFAQNRVPAQAAPASTRYVAIGCLTREAPSAANRPAGSAAFVLADPRGDKPSVLRLDGDAKQLDLHVGHTMEVAGPLSRAKTPAGETLVLKVDRLTWIASTCRKAS